jgi:hypothetical protein
MSGTNMYNDMEANSRNEDGNNVNFAQLFDTNLCKSCWEDLFLTGFISISTSYLSFLIENGFIIDDIISMMTFIKYTWFKGFVEGFMSIRQPV